MGVRLSIEVISPLDEDDHDLLTGVAIMTLAIANHEMARARFPEMFVDEEDEGDAPGAAASASSFPAATAPSEPVSSRTSRATRGGTAPVDDWPSRGGKGEVWPPDPRRDTERRS